jgi:hypothetical protein
MAFLDLTRTTLTPMCFAVLEWEGPTSPMPAPDSYTITAVCANEGHTVTVTVSGSTRIARVGQLMRMAAYAITLTAVYADPDDNVSADYELTMDVKAGYAQILRQSVWDILYSAGLSHRDRNLTCIHDGRFRPIEWPTPKGGFSPGMPAVEVCNLEMSSDRFATEKRKVQEYVVPIRIWESGNSGDPDSTGSLWLLMEHVQKAIDNTDNLNLSKAGISHRTWEWRKKKGLLTGRDSVTGFELELVVPVQRNAGTVAMS